jgi:NAD(P)-dependent dehydrogenase (short-subunit alcohol dehydrogenase family)
MAIFGVTPVENTKTINMTGATCFVGAAQKRRIAGDGHCVLALSRSGDRLAALRATCAGLPGHIEPLVVDLANRDITSIVPTIASRGLRIDAIVHAAVDLANQPVSPEGRTTQQQWNTEFQLAVVTPYELTLAVAERAGSTLKSVVNIASMYGVVPRNPALYDDPARQSPIHYGVAKAAMIHLTKELAVRLAPQVRVNAVSFGGIEGRADDAFRARYAQYVPMGRMLRQEEVSAAVAFLVSDDAAMITGQNLIVDGGWTTW